MVVKAVNGYACPLPQTAEEVENSEETQQSADEEADNNEVLKLNLQREDGSDDEVKDDDYTLDIKEANEKDSDDEAKPLTPWRRGNNACANQELMALQVVKRLWLIRCTSLHPLICMMIPNPTNVRASMIGHAPV